MALKFPGKLAIANERGHYSGSRMMKFSEGENNKGLEANINDYFEALGPHLIVDLKYSGDGKSALVTYTHLMNDDEKEEFDHFSREMDDHMSKWREKRDEQRAKDKEAKEKEDAETERFVDLGRKCEADGHAGMAAANKKLKKALYLARSGKLVELPSGVDMAELESAAREPEAVPQEPESPTNGGPTESSPPADPIEAKVEELKEGASSADSR